MTKLQAYAMKEFLPPFLLSICVFTFVMLLEKLLDLLDMIVTRGIPVRTVLEIFLLLLPSMIAVIVPMAVLAGVLMAFGRMSAEMEITAMKASGVGILTPMAPVFGFAVLTTLLLVYFNNSVLPDANHMARNLLLDIASTRPAARIIPGMFIDDIENYTILVGSKDDITGELGNVVIQQRLPGSGTPRTVTALAGRMEPVSANRMRLVLRDGQMQELQRDGTYRFLDFSSWSVEITSSEELTRRERESRSDREMSAAQMRMLVDSAMNEVALLRDSLLSMGRAPIETLVSGGVPFGPDSGSSDSPRGWFNQARNGLNNFAGRIEQLDAGAAMTERTVLRYRVEIAKKYSIPFACIVFVLLGVPLGIAARQSGAGANLLMSLVFILFYYLFLIGGESLADKGILPPGAVMWAPNALLGGLGVYLTARSVREGEPIPLLPGLRGFARRLSRWNRRRDR
ncbi:YjgP/YjgQ family permease [Candidatus Fermentibacteria bacterium]|nr:YjgP/YjgQ family permease [Candidatus Fermentibacteria bacterium]